MEKGLSISVKFNPSTGVLTIYRKNLTPLTCRVKASGNTFLEEGDNIIITGKGTELEPYVISAVLPGPEKISFSNASSLEVDYNAPRRIKYGNYPSFDLWINEDGMLRQEKTFNLTMDALPPDQTQYLITFSGPASGFLILKS